MEGVLILASIAKSIDFSLSRPDVPVEHCADVTLGPKEGLWVHPKKRDQPTPPSRL
jgi:hypothetical protein